MLDHLLDFGATISRSEDFECVFVKPAPASHESIEELASVLRTAGCRMPDSLRKLYQICDGMTLRWSYLRALSADRLTAGNVSLSTASTLSLALRFAPDAPALFDLVSDMDFVEIGLSHGELRLFYTRAESGESFALPISLDEYFDLLDRARALYPWQEMLITAPGFTLDPVWKKKFLDDLKSFFPDVDPGMFQGRRIV